MADDVVIRISAKDLSKKSFQDAIRNVAGVGNEAAKSSKKTSGLSTSYKQLVTGIIGGQLRDGRRATVLPCAHRLRV